VLAEDERQSIEELLNRLSMEDAASAGASRGISVDVLGRYQFQRDSMPRAIPKNVNATFRTVHGAKGLEADFVIITGVSAGTYGFPASVTDDPVLKLAMPTPESYSHAEERRLFYVALTRARLGVFVIARPSQPSPFVVELVSDHEVVVESAVGTEIRVCPSCRLGTLRETYGPYDPFFGCSRFPACRHKQKIECSKCGRGMLVKRVGRYGPFVGCSAYPTCGYTSNFKTR
jgi:DNA helicase-4